MNIEIHEGNENRLVQLTPVPPPFLPPCCLCAQPCPTEPDCAHDGKTQEVKPGIIHFALLQQLRHWPAESAGQAKRAGDTKGLIGQAQPVWVSTGPPTEYPQLREPLAAVAS